MGIEKLDNITKLAENLYLIHAPNLARFPHCNGFLFTGRQTVLIDTGIGETRIREIDKEARVDMLIITHSHPDHILAWHVLKNRHLLYPKEMPEAVYDLKLLGKRFTGTEKNGEYWAERIGGGLGIKPLREPDGRYEDGDLLDVGYRQIEAIHVPGHLCDHYCFFDRTSGTLLTTDIDFSSFGPWYGNPEADIELFESAVKKIMGFPYRQVCSSHKPPIIGDATQSFKDYLDCFNRQKRQVFNLCSTPQTLDQLIAKSPFYRDRFPDKLIQAIFERNMILKNMDLLIRDKKIYLSSEKYCQTR